MTRRLRAGAVAGLLVLAGCSVSPPEPARGEVLIGVVLPLSGPDAAESYAAYEAVARVLAEEFQGRAEGLTVSLRKLDDSTGGRRDPLRGGRNLASLVADPAVVGVIGPLNSDVAAAEIPVAAAAHLVMVSPEASSACLTRDVPACRGLARRLRSNAPVTFFRLVPSDDLEPAALLSYATTTLHLSHIAVASDGQAYGLAEREAFLAAMKHAGLAPAATADFDPTSATEADAFLTAARNGGADSVFFGGRDDGGACRVRARMKDKLDPLAPFLGGSGLRGPACLKDAGDAASGLYSATSGIGSTSERAALAARVLLRAVSSEVKAAGGNAPSREAVRAAVARSSAPRFDGAGDTTERIFTIYRGSPTAWTAAGTVKP